MIAQSNWFISSAWGQVIQSVVCMYPGTLAYVHMFIQRAEVEHNSLQSLPHSHWNDL